MKKMALSIILLGLSSVAMADLSASCKVFFQQVDSLVNNIPNDVATKQQAEMIKQNLKLTKQQISAMPKENQEEGCKQAIVGLKQYQAILQAK